jgi:hypothetical protein
MHTVTGVGRLGDPGTRYTPATRYPLCLVTYALMHLCTHALMHLCTYALMHSCTHALMHSCTYALMHLCTYAYALPIYLSTYLVRRVGLLVLHLAPRISVRILVPPS